MTRSEAMAKLAEAFTDRTICIELSAWSYPRQPRSDRVAYAVAILPGLNGAACDRFGATTLEQAVAAALGALACVKVPAPSAEIIDQHFAIDTPPAPIPADATLPA